MTFDYTSWLKTAHDRLEELYEQRIAIEEEISNLERGIEAFAPLVHQVGMLAGPQTGLTNGIRLLLRSYPTRAFPPTQIRDDLLLTKVRLTQKNPLATIHQVLARLVKTGEVKVVPIDARTHYQWQGKGDK